MGQRRARTRHLSLPGGSAQLPRELDDLTERGGAERLALGQQPAARVDGLSRAHAATAVAEPASAASARADAELLDREQLAPAIRVLDFEYVDVLRPDPGLRIGGVRR